MSPILMISDLNITITVIEIIDVQIHKGVCFQSDQVTTLCSSDLRYFTNLFASLTIKKVIMRVWSATLIFHMLQLYQGNFESVWQFLKSILLVGTKFMSKMHGLHKVCDTNWNVYNFTLIRYSNSPINHIKNRPENHFTHERLIAKTTFESNLVSTQGVVSIKLSST